MSIAFTQTSGHIIITFLRCKIIITFLYNKMHAQVRDMIDGYLQIEFHHAKKTSRLVVNG